MNKITKTLVISMTIAVSSALFAADNNEQPNQNICNQQPSAPKQQSLSAPVNREPVNVQPIPNPWAAPSSSSGISNTCTQQERETTDEKYNKRFRAFMESTKNNEQHTQNKIDIQKGVDQDRKKGHRDALEELREQEQVATQHQNEQQASNLSPANTQQLLTQSLINSLGNTSPSAATAMFSLERSKDGQAGWKNQEQAIKDYAYAKTRLWYENNKDKVKERHKRWYHKNLEKARANAKRLYENNKDKVKERHKCWYHKNLEKARAKNRLWRENNPDKVRASLKRWRENNLEKARESSRLWRENNPEKAKASAKRWYENNSEKAKASEKRWRENNPDKVRASKKRWRENNPDKVRAKLKRWWKNNPEKIEEYSWRQAYKRKRQAQLEADLREEQDDESNIDLDSTSSDDESLSSDSNDDFSDTLYLLNEQKDEKDPNHDHDHDHDPDQGGFGGGCAVEIEA